MELESSVFYSQKTTSDPTRSQKNSVHFSIPYFKIHFNIIPDKYRPTKIDL
jgi:hypothetical protein